MSVTAIGHFGGQVAWFGSLIVLGVLLAPDSFGVVAAGLVIVNAGTLLMGAGTGGSIVSTRHLASGEIKASIRLNLLLGAGMTIALLVLAGPITRQFASGGDPAVLRWLSLAIVLHAATVVPNALLKKQMHFGKYAMASFGAYTTAGVVAVLLGFAGAGVWSLVLRIVLYEGTLAVLAIWFARSALGAGQLVESDEGSRRSGGSWFFVLALANFVAFNADYMIIGRYTDAEQLGLYSLAFLLAFAALRQFSWQLGSVLFAASAATDAPADVQRKLTSALRIGSVAFLPAVIPAVVLAPIVIPAVLGDEWEAMVPPFQILVVAGFVHAILNIGAEFLSGTGHVDLRGRLSLVWAAAMVVTLLAVVPTHGILGAAVVHAALVVPMAVATTVLGARRLSLRTLDLVVPLRIGVFATFVQAAVTASIWAALEAFGLDDSWSVVGGALAGLVAAAAMLSTGDDPPLPTVVRLVRDAAVSRPTKEAA